jgi:tRNA A37 threonylcarbamoyladenosine dehydratase
MDHDEVEASNLHRQIIHTEGRVGMHKASSATAACRALNSTIQVRTHGQCLTAANALEVIRQYDVVLDCSDNPPTRYLIRLVPLIDRFTGTGLMRPQAKEPRYPVMRAKTGVTSALLPVLV